MKVHPLVDAGELAVEHTASAEAVSGRSGNGRPKARRPKGLAGAGGKYLCLEVGFGFDLCERCRIGFDEFGRDGKRTGAIVGGMNLDGTGKLSHFAARPDRSFDLRGSGWSFNIHACECKPAVPITGWKELEPTTEPTAIDNCGGACLNMQKHRRAGFDLCGNDGDRGRLRARLDCSQHKQQSSKPYQRADHVFRITASRWVDRIGDQDFQSRKSGTVKWGPDLLSLEPQFTARALRLCAGSLFGRLYGVVLLTIDLAAGTVELPVELGLVLAGELAAIRGAIGAILLVDALLAILGLCSFAR